MKVMSQPASHNCPIERREAEASSGTICTCRAAGGRRGRSSSASCVESMTEPLGLRIVMGEREGRRLRTGAEIVQKWAVLPVSAMAGAEEREEQEEGVVVQGGPIDGVAAGGREAEKAEVKTSDDINTFLTAGTAVASRGFPLGHEAGGGGAPRRGPRCAPRV